MDKLIYDKKAKQWKEALPLGNGSIGLMIYGGARCEKIAINDATLWSGYPKNQDNPQSLQNIEKVRQLIFDGKNHQADELAKGKMTGHYSETFLPLGWLKICFKGAVGADYKRSLDLERAIHTVSDAKSKRECLVSYPDKIAVYNISSASPHSFSIKADSKLHSAAFCDSGLNLVGNAPDFVAPNYLANEIRPVKYNEGKGMAFCLRAEIVTDGVQKCARGKMFVKNATKTSIYFTTATGFLGYDKMPQTDTKLCVEKCKTVLKNTLINTDYDTIKARHLADYCPIYAAHKFSLLSESNIATDKLVARAKEGVVEKSLVELVYNFGKYMTIAGSRKGGQPLNLQGLWNSSIRPPWSGNYTTNINAEMNYWGASSSNMAETIAPFIDMIYEICQHGKTTAKVNYGCGGFACNHNVDIWRKTAPVKGDPSYMLSPLCGVWLANEAFSHYQFGLLEDYADKIAEIVSEATRFALDFLVEKDGQWVVCPSASPENIFLKDGSKCRLDYATSFDMALIKQCFSNFLSIASKGRLEDETRIKMAEEVNKKIPLLYPFKEGENGICEWHKHFETPEEGHRHFSPLYGFYPARVIGYYNEAEERKWVEKLFLHRLRNVVHYYGWSGAWSMCIAARLRDSTTFSKVVSSILSRNIFKNLFDMHPPFYFQIDGNLGFIAGVNEALATCENSVIELLGALPKEWDCGEVKNMRFEGGVSLSFRWKNNKIVFVSASKPTLICDKNIDKNALLQNVEIVQMPTIKV